MKKEMFITTIRDFYVNPIFKIIERGMVLLAYSDKIILVIGLKKG